MISRASFQVSECLAQSQQGSHPAKSFTSQCFRSDCTRVHISLDCGHRQQFPKHQILNGKESCVYVFHSPACSLCRCHCSCFAAVCSISLKINSADSAPTADNSDSPLDMETVPSPLHSQRSTVYKLFLVIGSPAQFASEYPVMFFQFLAQVVGFRCWDRK